MMIYINLQALMIRFAYLLNVYRNDISKNDSGNIKFYCMYTVRMCNTCAMCSIDLLQSMVDSTAKLHHVDIESGKHTLLRWGDKRVSQL